MADLKMCLVAEFDCYDITTDKMLRSTRLATREAIERIGGKQVADTWRPVAASLVDADGFYIGQKAPHP